MKDIESKLIAKFDRADPEERCGFITKRGKIVDVDNIAQDKALGFHMDPKAVVEHADSAAATWHTHPDSEPNLSEADYAGFLNYPDMKHYIVGLFEGEVAVRCYYISNGLVLQA